MTSRKYTFALRIGAAALVGVGASLATQQASAQEPLPPVNGPTASGQICMQRVFGAPVVNSNKLNCTANDIRLSRALEVFPETCVRGSTITLTATFETIVTANARYDAGFFFRTDGVGTARGDGSNATGQCSLSALDFPPPPAQHLDGDSCGDLNAGTYELTFEIPDVKCEPAPGTDQVRLPNCTSWHSNQGTTCDIDELDNIPPLTAAELDFEPDTKSKCVCDDNFTVPVTVEEAEITVVKEATPATVPESGGTVTYTVTITNDAEIESVFINSIVDDLYGDLGTNDTIGVVDGSNTCPTRIGVELMPGESISCEFQAFVSGDADTVVTDVVDVCAVQEDVPEGTPAVCGTDDASVTIMDEFVAPSLTKSVFRRDCVMEVEYDVVVVNNSTVDTLTVSSLTDDKFDDLTQTHGTGNGAVTATNCDSVLGDIEPSGQRPCKFTGQIVVPGCTLPDHTNTATAQATDDDGRMYSPFDTATVTLSSTAP